ncbi:1-acyl-sn-glycerol-3-phosphate acyltransferase [Hoyosella rhizosphaerae]|uniref:1-acyl-sn-glycerol-3-phosphate acyltransferase n=1 Tax=Hoyosella rhizosphaerae TaxID=1755582 RepID=A0A916TZJ5_9ACTN|nr:lysophospholipid acyltransferase family protein [Hoyosella rhizosphaerae]MBN4927358.1 1-acyl-sn-glycerol-3-phosphate acyltransferase [Hoyosella rhizosphaerae]GGC51896.1 1-acyl-sn-glycerol-3-phosphate acyltransferase [Hoyosella rhizosphaerae]
MTSVIQARLAPMLHDERREEAHDWFPTSPCSCGCLAGDHATANFAVVTTRCVRLTSVLVAAPAFFAVRSVLPASEKRRWQRLFSKTLLSAFGVSVSITDRRGGIDAGSRSGLVVANHISWLDPLVISTITSAAFVARADLAQWPAIGTLARWASIIPLRRESLRDLPGAVQNVSDRLRRGDRVAIFPEGTTWCGRSWGRLRPAFFQSALDADVPIHPIHVRYVDGTGRMTTTPSFVGEDGIAQSIWRVLTQRHVTVEVTLLAPELAVGDRRILAQRCERTLRSAEMQSWTASFAHDAERAVA